MVAKSLAKAIFIPLVLAVFMLPSAGCCPLIPTNQDFIAYAPTLAPPLTRQTPGIGISVGYLAPDFKLQSLDGQEVSLSDYRGQPVMLDFWTYCDACKAEMPYIQNVYDNRGNFAPDLVVLAVNVSQPVDQVQQFVAYYGYTLEFLLDTWATVASDYYVHQIPTTLFIDKNGIIEDIQVGAFSGTSAITQNIMTLVTR